MDVRGKRVLITGAGSGLGAACAALLHAKGAALVLLDKNEVALQTWKSKAHIWCVDVCDTVALEQGFKTLPPVDVGIFCAGVLGASRIVGKHGPYPIDAFESVIQINLVGHFNVLRLLAHHMTQSVKEGVLIQTASVAAYEGQIGQAAYSASKGAIVSMTLPAARELARFGIRVMTIAPGVMDTPMAGQFTPEAKQALESQVLYPKRLGTPKEFAQLALHIIENDMLNGTVIRLDGGLRLP